jgi:hypothetical protein
MDEWIGQHSTPDDRAPSTRTRTRKTTAKKAVKKSSAKKAPAPGTNGTPRKAPVKKAAAKKSPARPVTDVAPDRSAIGSNRERRFSSTSSRDLAQKR